MNAGRLWNLSLAAVAGGLLTLPCLGAGWTLDGEWRLDYFPQPLSGAVRDLPLKVPFRTVKASVPGNCELDLVNAGVLPPLEIGLNVLQTRRYEGHQWLYTKTFDAPDVPRDGSRATLVFDGIDTLADVFLNGEKIGETANMLIPHRFDVTERLKKGANTVQVLIRSAFCETQGKSVGQMTYHMGFADNVPFRKAAHMGGWDIFPRIYASGLWRGVSLDVAPPVRIGDVAWITRSYRKNGTRNVCGIKTQFRVQGPIAAFTDGSTVRVSVTRNKECVASRERPLNAVHNSFDLTAFGFDLWWPKGAGAQPLYDAVIEIVSPDGAVLARDVRRIGFRTVELVRDDVYGPERPGQFLFKVNGEPIYVRGANWVPTDAVPSRQAGRIVETLEMFDDLNCNMVRVWGGGVYEPEAFFDFCDEHGIMVWQDFMTGCAQFPQDDRYAAATEEEARSVVLRFRNRPSLVLWSGNNENDAALAWSGGGDFGLDPNGDRPSRVTIPRVLREFDVTRPYLPSSPYHSPDVAAGKAQPSEMHLWGARGYYKTPFYTNSPCWFASEMGYHGAPNRASLERMMTAGCVYPWKNAKTNDCLALDWNDEWRLKASNPFLDRTSGLWDRNNLMTKQAKLMFGDVERDLDGFIAESQTIQAEAMKTFCELFRSRKFTRFNGLIWWNVRDGWPQISDAVVDYYGGKKQAYHALKAAQRDVLALLVDDHTAWVVNDLMRPVKGHALYRDRVTGTVLLDCDYEVAANSKKRLGEIAFSGQGLIDIEYTVDGGAVERNHFLYGEPPFRWPDVRSWLDAAPQISNVRDLGAKDGGVGFSISWGKPVELGPGGYARIHRLADGRLMAAYERGGDMIVRFNVDGRTDAWTDPQRVAWHFTVTNGSDVVRVNLANAEFAQLATGRILLACNMRPAGKRCDVHPYAIALTASDDGGKTWSPLRIVYKGGGCTDGVMRGCYEPFILPLAGGMAQLFYADETPYVDGRRKHQEISVIETADGGETWGAPRTVSYAPKRRDGMPVVLQLGEWRYLALESNPAKTRLHPQIIRSRVSDNWRDTVGYPSPDRFEPFRTPPDWQNNYGGAPYIVATENFVLLSWQECAGRGDVEGVKTAVRVAAVPKAEIHDGRFTTMRGASSPPDEVKHGLKMRWNALCPLDGDRFLLVSDCGGRIVVWPGWMANH